MELKTTKINGIDGCKKGWFVFSLTENSFECKIISSLEEIRNEIELSQLTLIDIPLGLEENKSSRICDIDLKKILGKKASSVFNAPIYDLLKAKTYEEACSLSFNKTGKKISLQAWYLIPKIRDANNFLQKSKNKELLKEFHPETGFYILNKCKQLNHSKKTENGINERLEILSEFIDAKNMFNQICKNTLRKDLAKDDIVDAMCNAVNGKFSAELKSIPVEPEIDKNEIKKEILISEF